MHIIEIKHTPTFVKCYVDGTQMAMRNITQFINPKDRGSYEELVAYTIKVQIRYAVGWITAQGVDFDKLYEIGWRVEPIQTRETRFKGSQSVAYAIFKLDKEINND